MSIFKNFQLPAAASDSVKSAFEQPAPEAEKEKQKPKTKAELLEDARSRLANRVRYFID